MKALRRLYHALHSQRAAQFRMLMGNAELSVDQARALHDSQLRNILQYAIQHVPRYRPLAAQWERMAPSAPIDELLSLFPVVTREDLRDRPQDYESDERSTIPCIRSATGGSTGDPLRFWQDRSYKSLGQAALMRSFAMMRCQPDEEVLWLWGETNAGPLKNRLRASFRPLCSGKRLINARQLNEEDFPRIIEMINRRRIRFIYGYVSSIFFLARWMLHNNAGTPGIQAVMTTAECLSPEQREIIASAFGARVLSQYGSREVTGVATECNHGNMHIFTDMVHLEAEASGHDPGPLLLTSLHNRSMPLIRYRNGDEGGLIEGECSCGLPFPLMRIDVGRIYDHFLLPSGKIVHAGLFTKILRDHSGIKAYQVIQRKRDLFDLKIVSNSISGKEDDDFFKSLPGRILSELGERVRVQLQFVDSIPLTPAGKHRFAISEVPRP